MNVKLRLKPPLKKFVDTQLANGNYSTMSELINVAVAHLQINEDWWKGLSKRQIKRLRKELDIGIAELDRGEGAPWDSEEIKREGRRLLAARRREAS